MLVLLHHVTVQVVRVIVAVARMSPVDAFSSLTMIGLVLAGWNNRTVK